MTYARAARVLWRLGNGRVLTRRVPRDAPGVEAQVSGSAAVVWLALGEPMRRDELLAELRQRDVSDPETELDRALGLLLEHHLIEERG